MRSHEICIDMSVIALLSWYQASMVNLASVKDGAFNDNGIPGLRGIMSSLQSNHNPTTRGEQNFRIDQNLSSRWGEGLVLTRPEGLQGITDDHRGHGTPKSK